MVSGGAWRQASRDEVVAAYEAFRLGRDTWSAAGDLDLRDLRAGRARKLGIRILAAQDGRLYIKGSVAVVTALEVICDGSRFWFQVPSKKTVWTGHATAEPHTDVDDAPYYALRPSDVTASLFPPPFTPAAGESVALEADHEAFSLGLVGADGAVRMRLWLSRQTLELARLRIFDARGDLRSESTYTAWQDGQPRRVTVTRPREGYQAAFWFDKLSLHAALPDRAFVPRLPADYKVVEVPES